MSPPTIQSMMQISQKIRDANSRRSSSALSILQRQSRHDPGLKSPGWISKVSFPAPMETNVCEAVFDAINALSDDSLPNLKRPDVMAVEAEWVGSQKCDDAKVVTEQDKYEALMRDVQKPTTILYARGGAFYLFGPSRPRPTALRLAELTKGRCITIDYRLAPQNPFPAALIDLLISYLSLLYPPPGSLHDAVPASAIVLAGESAGAALCLSLIQTIMALRRLQARENPLVQFHGRTVEVPVPAGVTGVSGGMDQALAVPSYTENAKFDWLADELPCLRPGYPPCEIWPSVPPRAHVYCDATLLHHPLVSPVTAESWTGSPPMWLVSGQERLTDAVKVIAKTACKQKVCVLWEQYEGMPHTWPMILEELPQTTLCFQHWARACNDLVAQEDRNLSSHGIFITVEDLQFRDVSVENLTQHTAQEVRSLIKNKAEGMSVWTGKDVKANM